MKKLMLAAAVAAGAAWVAYRRSLAESSQQDLWAEATDDA